MKKILMTLSLLTAVVAPATDVWGVGDKRIVTGLGGVINNKQVPFYLEAQDTVGDALNKVLPAFDHPPIDTNLPPEKQPFLPQFVVSGAALPLYDSNSTQDIFNKNFFQEATRLYGNSGIPAFHFRIQQTAILYPDVQQNAEQLEEEFNRIQQKITELTQQIEKLQTEKNTLSDRGIEIMKKINALSQ